jgi:hypothetical protein
VAAHRHQPGPPLCLDHAHAVGEVVAQRDLDLDVLARFETGDRLLGVHLGRRGEHHRVDLVEREALGEIGRDVVDPVFLRDLTGRVELATDHGDHTHVVDVLHGIEMLDAECSGPCEGDVDGHGGSVTTRSG